jgi:carbonic anhydrase
VEEGSLALHGWYFDMERGELLQYLPDTGRFEVLVPNFNLHGDMPLEQIVTPGM